METALVFRLKWCVVEEKKNQVYVPRKLTKTLDIFSQGKYSNNIKLRPCLDKETWFLRSFIRTLQNPIAK